VNLIKRDRFTSTDLNALWWVFESDDDEAIFWRQQLCGVPGLRRVCKNGMTKFASIHERWGDAVAGKGIDPSGKHQFTARELAGFEAEERLQAERKQQEAMKA